MYALVLVALVLVARGQPPPFGPSPFRRKRVKAECGAQIKKRRHFEIGKRA